MWVDREEICLPPPIRSVTDDQPGCDDRCDPKESQHSKTHSAAVIHSKYALCFVMVSLMIVARDLSITNNNSNHSMINKPHRRLESQQTSAPTSRRRNTNQSNNTSKRGWHKDELCWCEKACLWSNGVCCVDLIQVTLLCRLWCTALSALRTGMQCM